MNQRKHGINILEKFKQDVFMLPDKKMQHKEEFEQAYKNTRFSIVSDNRDKEDRARSR